MQYDVVYEDKYLKPGFVIYRKDYKQFIKVMSNLEDGRNTFTFVASDGELDDPRDHFRVISYAFKENQHLYSVFHHLKESMQGGCSYSLNPLEEGINQFFIDEKAGILYVHFIKDLVYSQNLHSNALKITLGGSGLQQFFTELDDEKITENKEDAFEKMISLKTQK